MYLALMLLLERAHWRQFVLYMSHKMTRYWTSQLHLHALWDNPGVKYTAAV